jgi:hypothetical protein
MILCPFTEFKNTCRDNECELWSNAEEECSIKSVSKGLNRIATILEHIEGCMKRM